MNIFPQIKCRVYINLPILFARFLLYIFFSIIPQFKLMITIWYTSLLFRCFHTATWSLFSFDFFLRKRISNVTKVVVHICCHQFQNPLIKWHDSSLNCALLHFIKFNICSTFHAVEYGSYTNGTSMYKSSTIKIARKIHFELKISYFKYDYVHELLHAANPTKNNRFGISFFISVMHLYIFRWKFDSSFLFISLSIWSFYLSVYLSLSLYLYFHISLNLSQPLSIYFSLNLP